jgi:glycosyltransferase involved in cell wall biosynthesis
MPARVGIELTSWSNRRGYGRFTRGLVTALLDRDDPVEYVFFVDPHAESAELPRRGEIVPLPLPPRSDSESGTAPRSLALLRAAGRAIAARPLDVLFFPSVHAWVPVRTGARILLGIHDVIAEDYPHLVFPRLADRWRWRVKSAWARRQATAILTVSEHAREGLVRRFGLAPERVFVVGEAAAEEFHPIAAEEIDRDLLATLDLAPGAPVVAYLGGLNPHKNLPALVDAVMALRRRPGLERTRLLLIGDLGDPFTPGIAALREHLRAHGAESAVSLTGFLPDAEVAQLLNAATLLALPSWTEGFGLPAIEAAACGTPVVATARSPLPQLLAGGGLFVDPARPDELTDAIGRILADPALRSRLAATARERAAELTWSRAAERFHAVVERLRSAP